MLTAGSSEPRSPRQDRANQESRGALAIDGWWRGISFRAGFSGSQIAGAPGVSAGDNVIGHFWYRYPTSPLGAVFSGGVQIPVCP